MNETIDENKTEFLPTTTNQSIVEDSIASRTKEITKRPKRERSPTLQIQPPPPKIKKIKEVAPKLPDKTKWTMEEQKQFFSALRIYGKNFEALAHCFNSRRRLVNPEAQKRTFGQIRCFYYRSFRTVSKLCTFTEDEKLNIDSFELRSVLAYLCLKPKVKCFDKKPTITVLHQLIRNGNAFLRVKGQREHVSIIGKALKPPKVGNGLGNTRTTDRNLSKHVKILLSPASAAAYMRVSISCRYPHVEVLISRTTTVSEFLDRLTQYWQLNHHAQTLFKDDLSMEQVVLYPHSSYLSASSSNESPTLTSDSAPILDLTARKQLTINVDKQTNRSRSDSEYSTEPLIDSSSTSQTGLIRKRNHLSESEVPNDSNVRPGPSISPSSAPSTPVPSSSSSSSVAAVPTVTTSKSNLARTAILLAAKRAANHNSTNHNSTTSNLDGCAFTLIDGTEDEPDSSSAFFKQRFDAIDLIDEFASEDEIEPENQLSLPNSISAAATTNNTISATNLTSTTTSTTVNTPTVTLLEISQGITRLQSFSSTLTIGELHKICQRPKELRLVYDFNNLLKTANPNDSSSSTAFLHYVIQMANQCLTSMNDRQSQSESKTTKKSNGKKQQTNRSKCFCSCCSHQHTIAPKEQRRPMNKASNSPNAEICALLQMPQSIPSQDIIVSATDDISAIQGHSTTNPNNLLSDGDAHNKSLSLPPIDEQSNLFASLTWSTDSRGLTIESSQTIGGSQSSSTTKNPAELPSLMSLLLPIMNGVESTNTTTPSTTASSSTSIPQTTTTTTPTTTITNPLKQPAIMFTSNNGVIDDPLIQSLAAEQAASAHNYDLLSHRNKRVRRPLRYGDQSTRPSNIQLLLDANINAQQNAAAAAAANQRLIFNTNVNNDLSVSNNPFRSDCENPNDLLNDNTNMSTVSLSTTIVNAALQSNASRLRLDWPDNMSDLSFGSFPDLLESNTLSAGSGELTNLEQSNVNNPNDQNKCASASSISEALFAINNTTNLLLQN